MGSPVRPTISGSRFFKGRPGMVSVWIRSPAHQATPRKLVALATKAPVPFHTLTLTAQGKGVSW